MVPVLVSSVFAGNPDLERVAAGQRRIQAPEVSDSVGLLQQALVTLGFELPQGGVDGRFGRETGDAVSAFKNDRDVRPADPIVGRGTMERLDLELSFLDGADDARFYDDRKLIAAEPFTASVLDAVHPDVGVGRIILDLLEHDDEFCFSMSMAILDAPLIASYVGRLVEPKITADYCFVAGPCTPADDFADLLNLAAPYKLFLAAHNPAISPAVIDAVGSSVRPDLLSHRPGVVPEWYEIKPLSPAGAAAGVVKGVQLKANYGGNGLPYVPGIRYRPSRKIPLGRFVTPPPFVESLEVYIEARRLLPGLIFYRLCIRGDTVRFFNRVSVVSGLLAILAALAPELLAVGVAAEEVAAFGAAVRAAAQALGIGALPAVAPSL